MVVVFQASRAEDLEEVDPIDKSAFYTLGCKVNQYETERLLKDFCAHGYDIVDFPSRAGVYVINTCRVTEVSEEKSRKAVRRAARSSPGALVVVTGCYPAAATGLSGSIRAVSNERKGELAALVDQELGRSVRQSSGSDVVRRGQWSHSRALVKVEDGCDRRCTYCIVPQVRGRPRSRPRSEVREEVRELLRDGVREIVLTGVNLGLYGEGLPDEPRLADLLKILLELPGLGRIRLSSLNVSELTPELIELAGHPKLCPHFHLPLQSGSTRILRQMNRSYTGEQYRTTVERLSARRPDLALTTDIIVGFPGENEKDFAETVTMVEKIRFRKLHVFKFSARPGTPAAQREDRLDARVVDRRSQELRVIGERLAWRYEGSSVGRIVEVVAEQEDRGLWWGTSGNYLRVCFPGPAGLQGEFVKVRLDQQRGGCLAGTVVGSQAPD